MVVNCEFLTPQHQIPNPNNPNQSQSHVQTRSIVSKAALEKKTRHFADHQENPKGEFTFLVILIRNKEDVTVSTPIEKSNLIFEVPDTENTSDVEIQSVGILMA
ncbi:unnamed protein product [Cylindrotheca closterium]|uniref:Uncharacterized protein n=1 Tax=Cylindrotheca closterium TaxID=2856 RepID=A0AAD2FRT9_9STRA|nr:unnamed protein product [Cylindrotheca closterium]